MPMYYVKCTNGQVKLINIAPKQIACISKPYNLIINSNIISNIQLSMCRNVKFHEQNRACEKIKVLEMHCSFKLAYAQLFKYDISQILIDRQYFSQLFI